MSGKVKLHKTATGIGADFEIQFTADFTCVRCLERFCNDVNVKTHLDYIEGKDPLAKAEKIELHRMDMDKVYYRGSQIDVGIGMREAIILALPLAPLCNENCRGLCPVCGINLNRQKCDCKVETVGLFSAKNSNVKKNK